MLTTRFPPVDVFALQFTSTQPNAATNPTLTAASSSSSSTHSSIRNINSTTNLVLRLWRRLDPNYTHHLSHNLSLALTHMIFMELVLRAEPPYQQWQKLQLQHDSGDQVYDDDEICAFTPNRQKLNECYGNWIVCSCGCGRKWNFANGFEGLRRDERKVKDCKVERWMNAGKRRWRPDWGVGRGDAGAELFEKNRTSWLEGRQPAIAK